jgi:hypothetical protein
VLQKLVRASTNNDRSTRAKVRTLTFSILLFPCKKGVTIISATAFFYLVLFFCYFLTCTLIVKHVIFLLFLNMCMIYIVQAYTFLHLGYTSFVASKRIKGK